MLDRSRAVAADASHHLQTLAAMRLRLEAIADTTHDADTAAQAEAATLEVDRLTRRVDQVLALATAETAAQNVIVDVGESAHTRTIDWKVLLRRTASSCSATTLPRPFVRPSVRSSESWTSWWATLDYADAEVQIHVTDDGQHVRLVVRDDGPGIPADERESVFTRFKRGSQPVPGGTGLGLALVRQAAIASGGDVQIVDSPVGACFEVSWPSLADTDQSEHKDARS